MPSKDLQQACRGWQPPLTPHSHGKFLTPVHILETPRPYSGDTYDTQLKPWLHQSSHAESSALQPAPAALHNWASTICTARTGTTMIYVCRPPRYGQPPRDGKLCLHAWMHTLGPMQHTNLFGPSKMANSCMHTLIISYVLSSPLQLCGSYLGLQLPIQPTTAFGHGHYNQVPRASYRMLSGRLLT